jgi:hypothetical protein
MSLRRESVPIAVVWMSAVDGMGGAADGGFQ